RDHVPRDLPFAPHRPDVARPRRSRPAAAGHHARQLVRGRRQAGALRLGVGLRAPGLIGPPLGCTASSDQLLVSNWRTFTMLSSIKDTLGVARTMAPLLTKAARSGQLFSPACELTPPNDDVVCRYDVQVPVEDGFYLTANVFYSRAAEAAGKRVPVIMSAHPYDNNKLPARGRT